MTSDELRALADCLNDPNAMQRTARRKAADYLRAQADAQRLPRVKPTHEAADAFWRYWRENGETHKHGYYESTWGAINAALSYGLEQREPLDDDNDPVAPQEK